MKMVLTIPQEEVKGPMNSGLMVDNLLKNTHGFYLCGCFFF